MGADFRIYEYLLDFLFQSIEFRSTEEFAECDFQTITELLYGNGAGVLTLFI